MASPLQHQPKSVILEHGYINVYSELNPKEKRQLSYKRRYKKENPSWDETMVYLSHRFSELCGNDAVVLDAGCGNGNYIIDENRGNIAWAVGVDVSADYTSKNICLDDIKTADLGKLPFESDKFDMVTSLWVLEHLENPLRVFGEIHRVLKPGGVFMFATPNKSFLPLKIVHTIKLSRFNHLLNRTLFGRDKQDVFPAYYKANTIKDIAGLSQGLFDIDELKLNSDVSYTSFNEPSYLITKGLLKLPGGFSRLMQPHIIGVLRKRNA
ncbi:MAG: methyltransferase type 11 [candidate division WWE3 bacterium GW2011_GWC1_41_7]|uniref:Methyltransferase type 11 n=4 Tax=Katanobacteria TaxID=422282 RepID=A0A0G0X6X7_UNCKA|nr:MAG: Methyltransferase type 11 [candidate division WWE3 bacterium GW2011_GWB1_41_6]KKS20695.1 MAG: methyltransferase type 11 [candidate division WWE3 bacterium GW2011_GWC1_41_7]KKS21934.1 MAG: Methyltransferase type 11 [candidate division WWE3 bacterium GW2011_GWA1_41_8]OGC57397.1 MAG: hypothetical protein A2976_04240 [candidate division WWE3 bacterium RIFCSPLOWO2_01_FULL_41_9]